MKKLYSVAAAAIAGSFLLTGVAFASFGVNVSTTSEEVAAGSPCDLGPAFTFEFGPDSILTAGDEIIVDLPFNPNGSKVTLCKGFDYVIAPGDEILDLAALDATNMWDFTNHTIAAKTNLTPFGFVGTTPVVGNFTGAIAFHVTGTQGGDRIKIEILGAAAGNNVKVQSAAGDALLLDIFKRVGSVANGGAAGNYEAGAGGGAATGGVLLAQDDTNTSHYGGDGAVGSVADEFVDADDNTLCMNVSQWPGATVDASITSKPNNVFTFAPTNPEIAHLRDGAVAFQNCNKSVVGPVAIRPITQASPSCTFDNETPTTYAGTHNNKILITSLNDFKQERYDLRLTILTAPEGGTPRPGDGGVYFTPASATVSANGGTTTVSADLVSQCADFAQSGAGRYTSVFIQGAVMPAGMKAMVIDLPTLIYDYPELAVGDIVDMRIELFRAPCGVILEGDKPIVRSFQDPSAASATLIFPYFATPGAFWNGIALVNMSNEPSEVDLRLTEVDGDVAEGTVTIQAGQMYTNTLMGMIQQGVLQLTAGSGELGDANAYMRAQGPGIDGFAIMSNGAGVSAGYLPRN